MEGRLKLSLVAALTLLVAVISHAFPPTFTFNNVLNSVALVEDEQIMSIERDEN